MICTWFYRIGYSVYELKRVKEEIQHAPNLKVVMMYDIACTLSAHLKVSK